MPRQLARLHCLTRTDHAKAPPERPASRSPTAPSSAGPRARATPSKKCLAQLDAVYRQVRRHNVARHLLQRLNRQGRGTRVEFHPLNQSQVFLAAPA